MKINVVIIGLIAVLVVGGCGPTKPTGDGLTLRQRCVKDFRIAGKHLDIHAICRGSGRRGVFRVYDRLIKGSFAHYIVTGSSIIGSRDAGFGFAAAAEACSLFGKLPEKVDMAAGLYLMLNAKGRHGQLLQSGTGVDFAPESIGVTAPKAVKSGDGYLLDFWGKDTSAGRFYHYRIRIAPDSSVTVESTSSKKAP